MARLVVGFVVAAALGSSAGAQPVTQPQRDACRVTIALAPADVRAEIEAWVRAEPRCERELEVRVVPTEDGLYLSARDPQGRVRERVVPDAQSAAVLVVSWMADDSLGPTFPEHAASVAPEVPHTAMDDDELPDAVELGAPGLTRTMKLRERGAGRRWLSLGLIGSRDAGDGFRGQVDVLSHSMFTVGIGGGWRSRDDRGGMDDHTGSGQLRLFVGTGYTRGRLSVRAQLGVGADVTAHGDRMEARDRSISPIGEASVFANVRITDRWGLIGGPVVETSFDDHPTKSMFLGVRRGL
jgi:hypothetical protein